MRITIELSDVDFNRLKCLSKTMEMSIERIAFHMIIQHLDKIGKGVPVNPKNNIPQEISESLTKKQKRGTSFDKTGRFMNRD